VGRVNPYTFQQDPTLRRLIDVVPFGLPASPPQHTRPVLKGVYKTITSEDKVILWGGGIWNWFDTPTLIKAMPLVLQQRNDVKLFFMGIHRPNRNIPRMRAVDEAIELSKNLKLYDNYVFFNDWVPYHDRQNYLLEADLGVSLHLDYVETRFAFRTRLLDYLWANLLVVTTGGDVLSDTLAAHNLAYVVKPGDVQGVAQTILTLLDKPLLRADYAARFEEVAVNYRWDVVIRPLLTFCAAPYLSPDKAFLQKRLIPAQKKGEIWKLLSKSWRTWRLDGLYGLLRQSNDYIRWKINQHRKL
jgi:hypothetical protein